MGLQKALPLERLLRRRAPDLSDLAIRIDVPESRLRAMIDEGRTPDFRGAARMRSANSLH